MVLPAFDISLAQSILWIFNTMHHYLQSDTLYDYRVSLQPHSFKTITLSELKIFIETSVQYLTHRQAQLQPGDGEIAAAGHVTS